MSSSGSLKNTFHKVSILKNCENEINPTPHCSKTMDEKVDERKNRSIRVESNGKKQQKNKNSCMKLKIIPKCDNDRDYMLKNFKKLTLQEPSVTDLKTKVQKIERIRPDNNFQDEQQNLPKQRNKKTLKTGKERHKLKEPKYQEFECDSTKKTENIKEENVFNAQGKAPKQLKGKDKFPEHIPRDQVREILSNQNSINEDYAEGYLRINPKYSSNAYLNSPGEKPDILIAGPRDRNRAFDGDYVVVRIHPQQYWQLLQNGQTQRTGVIVSILEEMHPRIVVGYVKHKGVFLFFYPRDKRVPILKIDKKKYPLPKECATAGEDTLFLAEVTDWVKPKLANGKILRLVGTAGDVSVESNAILLELNLDVTPYNQEIIKDLPNKDYRLTENDIKDREDWRNECVFTIDPESSADLDDAVSCKLLENGNYEIGVHIADVTYYLEFLSPLDVQVAKRATTIYMTDNVYHMLPTQLCNVCSLVPGQDKLTFSVICEVTPEAKIVKYRFAKTVINSSCKMSYNDAQKFIENPENNWSDDTLHISGNYNINDLSSKVNTLHKLASKRRCERYANGALEIDQPKLHVTIDRSTGEPVSYYIEEHKESNRLIQEFMLLANMIVARFLYNNIPETALLRNHRGPSMSVLNKTKDVLQKFGIHLDIESSGSLHNSIIRYKEELESESNDFEATMKYRMMVINNLCSKAMNRATYNCSSIFKSEEELRHYALNVAHYTHFTSPIRRYSDCVVHRLLYSVIKNEPLPETWSDKLCMRSKLQHEKIQCKTSTGAK
ncbi:DIS3-like exonuclease 2 isoform X2 [Nomia melanderi]|uniref:DIS3-like exonuclease 2 isoform X2 n=1 Tax=Nomia melanderi TaxID=2448451 RepID=UPI0013042330|nr:DIS3-like exonuclease 2 isoform X2 [Nomia melanderi]